MNQAAAWYRAVHKRARRVSSLSLERFAHTVKASALPDARKQAILCDLASIFKGEVECPECAAVGPHPDNGHHALGKLRFTCRACGASFHATNT